MKKILLAACIFALSLSTPSSYSQSLKQKIKQQQSAASSAEQRCDELKAKVQYGEIVPNKNAGHAFFVDNKGAISEYRGGFCSYEIFKLGQTIEYEDNLGQIIPAAKCFRGGVSGNSYSRKRIYEFEIEGNELVAYEQFVLKNCISGSLNEGEIGVGRYPRIPGR